MNQTPCEIIFWDFLPALRREIVKALIKNGIPRKKIANKFGITEAAISQYLKSKRGTNFKFTKLALKEIEKVAVRIINSKGDPTVEFCRLCCKLKKEKFFRDYLKKNISFPYKCFAISRVRR